jgi:transposase InsO family protein
MPTLTALLGLLRSALADRQRLLLENAAPRHQVAVLKRSVMRPRIEDSDRIFWIALRRLRKEWKDCLLFVRPETVLRWHRNGARYYWARKSKRHTVGRPSIGWPLVALIKRLSVENVLWSAGRIADELAKLGHSVSEATVEKYRVHRRNPERGQRWTTFLRNHLGVTAACDFFVVPTLTFKMLYGFVVLSHDRRRIVHVGVTAHPTGEWTAQQIREAFPGDGGEPRFLLHDRDAIFGEHFSQTIEAMGLEELLSGRQSPWMNPYCERVIGTIRRECLDHIIPMGERHLLRTIRSCLDYYNTSRTHQSLDGDAPVSRSTESAPAFDLVSEPVLGGLHKRYRRAA